MSDWARKFGLKAGQKVYAAAAPAGALAVLAAEAPLVEVVTDWPATGCVDQIFYWPPHLDGLAGQMNAWLARLEPAGAIWLLMPKKKFAVARGTPFTWNELQEAGLATDMVDNKIASFSDTDYGTRFVIRRERRAAYGKNCGSVDA